MTKNDLTIRAVRLESGLRGQPQVADGAPGRVLLRGAVESPEFGFLLDNPGVTVQGFDIRLFHESGIRISRGGNNAVRRNVTAINSHDGIQLGSTSSNLIEHNITFGNSPGNTARACGIQLLEAVVSPFGPTNSNVIRHNTISQEAFGIRLENGTGNVIFSNHTSNNRRFGILNRAGANDTVIERNRAFDNVGSDAAPTEGRGLGVTGSTGVLVSANNAFGNTLDIFWDGTGANTFESNRCNSSVPDGLCEDPQGYWLAAADGGVFAHGNAGFFGSMGGQRLAAPVVGIDSSPNPHGYLLVASDGGIFSFGSAGFFGSMGGTRLNAPVVGMAATHTGNGYWLVARDDGIFSFGDAQFFGSMGGQRLNAPVVGMARTSNSQGYALFASDGGVFTFGNASFHGSMGGQRLAQPVVGGDATSN